MKFDLNEDQLALRDAVADYLTDNCPASETLAAHEHSGRDRTLWEGLMALGLGGVNAPERLGGMGLSMLDLAVIAEVTGRFAAPGRFFVHALATQAMLLSTNDDLANKWLPRLIAGDAFATIAIGEGNQLWMANEWSIEGTSALSGTKRHVPYADEADLFIVGIKGGGLVLVESGAQGLSIFPHSSFDAGRALFDIQFASTPFTSVSPDGARLCDAGLILLSADAFGGASHCVESSVAYAKEREQFGRQIGAFQAVKHQLADMALEVEPTAGLFWHAALSYDKDPAEGSRSAALAKAHLTELYAAMARRMIEMHGGIGYTWEFGAHVWLKRSVFNRNFLGMPSRHRARYADLADW